MAGDGFSKMRQAILDRDNPTMPEVVIGTVISLIPFKVRLYNEVILENKHLYMSSSLLQRVLNVNIPDIMQGDTIEPKEDYNGVINVEADLVVGDLISIIPIPSSKKYYIIDKVVKL